MSVPSEAAPVLKFISCVRGFVMVPAGREVLVAAYVARLMGAKREPVALLSCMPKEIPDFTPEPSVILSPADLQRSLCKKP